MGWHKMTRRDSLETHVLELHAVIGVWHRGDLTYYVKRSEKMENYPGLWSLFSIQFRPDELRNSKDLSFVRRLMQRLSQERLGGVPITVKEHLISGDSRDNPIGKHVYLHLYEIELAKEPNLNPDYYSGGAWLTPEEYERRSAGQLCGLCLRLWSDYAWLAGISDRPFVAREVVLS